MKKVLLIIISIFFWGNINAQKKQQATSSLLWEVSGKGLKAKSYLFGTFHMICKKDFTVTPILKQKLNSCKILFEEMGDDEMKAQFKMIKLLKSDTSLEQLMDSVSYQKLSKGFKEITGMPLMLFNNFKPFMASSMMTMKMIECEETIQPEKEFSELAKKKKMPIKGFETIEDQLGAFNKVPLDSQINSLVQMANNIDSIKLLMKQFIEVYKQGNIDSIYTFMQLGNMGEMFETALLNERNNNWLPIIEKSITSTSNFIAVGAGHLCGPNGLVSLLRKKGYTVKPIKY